MQGHFGGSLFDDGMKMNKVMQSSAQQSMRTSQQKYLEPLRQEQGSLSSLTMAELKKQQEIEFIQQ